MTMSVGPIDAAQAERFKRLAWPLMPVVLRAAQCLTRNAAQADDLAQETMIKAVRAIDSYRSGGNIKAWLLTILRRTHIDWLRVEQQRPLRLSLDQEGIDMVDGGDTDVGRFDEKWTEPEDLLGRFEDDAVIEALRELPDDMRWTLLLVDVEQMDHADAAEALHVAVGTIKSRTHRGRAMLRDRLFDRAVKRGWVDAKEQSA